MCKSLVFIFTVISAGYERINSPTPQIILLQNSYFLHFFIDFGFKLFYLIRKQINYQPNNNEISIFMPYKIHYSVILD